mmetsp:Transcript_7945/g.11831  ORF Transcript_7945/g.11831 Transcript_7945/m.11831 type:complete len:255 (+) Transcript_7945:80-844(+)
MTDSHQTRQQERSAPMAEQGLPPSGQQFERKKQYRARGCRGGAYRKGRTQRSASYNMRRDQERRGQLDTSAHQENDPHRLNRHHTSYHHNHHNHNHHNRNHRNHHHHHHRNQHYHGRRPHPSNFIKKESSDHSHDAKSRTLSILPSGEDVQPEGDEATCPTDVDAVRTATSDKTDQLPDVQAPILPSSSSDSAASAPLPEPAVAPKSAVIAPISKVAKEHSIVTKQAVCNFSFFALSPSSFLTGKKAQNGRSYF